MDAAGAMEPRGLAPGFPRHGVVLVNPTTAAKDDPA